MNTTSPVVANPMSDPEVVIDSTTTTLTLESGSECRCRFCATPLRHTVVDLGTSPLCQKHVRPEDALNAEPFFRLAAMVCDRCWLVQLDEVVAPEVLFDEDYAYYSSYSISWLNHVKKYADRMIEELQLGPDSLVAEIASNDGYLLQWFAQQDVPVLGIEPVGKCAEVARSKGVRTESVFFGQQTAEELSANYGKADLLLGNNVLAHVPDINDFVAGMKIMLAEDGVITMEFPHLQRLMEGNEFDTIYHEHFSYFSFTTVNTIFAHHGLTLFDVEELNTHGGSLRIHGRHAENENRAVKPSVTALLQREEDLGYTTVDHYRDFDERVKACKRNLLSFLVEAKRQGKSVAGYGAPGKGNTLLNYCGIRTDFIDYTVDRNPHKQGNLLPGTRIPIFSPEKIFETKPDYVLILPWNLSGEISQQMAGIREWGGQFVVPIPDVKVLP